MYYNLENGSYEDRTSSSPLPRHDFGQMAHPLLLRIWMGIATLIYLLEIGPVNYFIMKEMLKAVMWRQNTRISPFAGVTFGLGNKRFTFCQP